MGRRADCLRVLRALGADMLARDRGGFSAAALVWLLFAAAEAFRAEWGTGAWYPALMLHVVAWVCCFSSVHCSLISVFLKMLPSPCASILI